MSSKLRRKKRADPQINVISGSDSNKAVSFFRVFDDFAHYPKMINLSYQAKWLYVLLGLRCNSQDKERHLICTFPRSEQNKIGMRSETFMNAKNELLENGFIVQERFANRGTSVRFRLSDNWKKFDGVVPEDKRYF